MKLVFNPDGTEQICTDFEAAKKFFSGDVKTANALILRINFLKEATAIKEIIVQPQYRFHALNNRHKRKLKGYFAIDNTSKRSPWRIILRPLDADCAPFNPCNINEIAHLVEVISIEEVSKHYE